MSLWSAAAERSADADLAAQPRFHTGAERRGGPGQRLRIPDGESLHVHRLPLQSAKGRAQSKKASGAAFLPQNGHFQ